MKDKKVLIFDVQLRKSSFCFSYINSENGDYGYISFSDTHKDSGESVSKIVRVLSEAEGLVGYNSLNYGYPLLHHIIENRISYKEINSAKVLLDSLNKVHKSLLENSFNHIPVKDSYVYNLDLYMLWGLNRYRTPLNNIKFNIALDKIVDLVGEELEDVIEFTNNNANAIYKLYKLSRGKINARKTILSRNGMETITSSDSKLVEDILLKDYSARIGANEWDVRKSKTNRDLINLSEAIPEDLSLEGDVIRSIVDNMSKTPVRDATEAFKGTIKIGDDNIFNIGVSGLYLLKESILEETDILGDKVIIQCDIISAYINTIVNQGFIPDHLRPAIIKSIKARILDPMTKASGNDNSLLREQYKELAVRVTGKMNSNNSFLFDQLAYLKVVFYVQLHLIELFEKLVEKIESINIIQAKNDGFIVSLEREEANIFYTIVSNFCMRTRFDIKYNYLSKIALINSNSYLALGLRDDNTATDVFSLHRFHPNNFHPAIDAQTKIVAKALFNYYKEGIPVEDTIMNSNHITDFLLRTSTDGIMEIHRIKDGELKIHKTSGFQRYYIANSGSRMIRVSDTGRKAVMHQDHYIRLINDIKDSRKDIKAYGINYRYYISLCREVIEKVKSNQLKLL